MSSPTAPVNGSVAPGFEQVRDVFAQSFTKGEVGAAVCIYRDGEPVVDLWGGWKDAARTSPWERDTIVNTFSTTKGMTTVCLLQLVEQGKVDLDAPVATYWPEFAAAGKDKVTVRHLLTHQAGLPALDTDLGDARFDWDAVTSALAAQAPAWEPGTQSTYHALTFGYLVGEVVRRVDGRSLGTYFREEIAEPLGVDYMIGFGPEHDARCAEVIPPPLPSSGQTEDPVALMTRRLSQSTDTRAWRAAEIPAANGHGSAAGVARFYAAIARGGELDGVRILEEATIDAAMVRQHPSGGADHGADPSADVRSQLASSGVAGITGLPFGLGFMRIGDFLAGALGEDAPGTGLFGHPGLGGSMGLADRDAKLGIGYVMNQMQGGMAGGSHGFALIMTAYACLA